VMPPQPDGIWQVVYNGEVWKTSPGEDKYRRALYTYRYRSVPYPVLQNFDAPTGEFSCPRRLRSNTPLQALTTLNEEVFLDCARSLATKIVTEGGDSDRDRIDYALRRCVARDPQPAELAVLEKFLAEQRERFESGSADPWALISGEVRPANEAAMSQLPGKVPPAELAAWTALARVVLNLDETITKE